MSAAATQSGSLFVVEDACKFQAGDTSGVVVIAHTAKTVREFPTAIEELTQSGAAKKLALAYAATQGLGSPRVELANSPAYCVNADGEVIENLKDESGKPLPPNHPRRQPVQYRVDVPVQQSQGIGA